MSILVIYQKTPKCYQSEQNCSEKISNLFKFTVLGKLVLLCYVAKEKKNSYIPTSKVIRSCSYGKISIKTSNAF